MKILFTLLLAGLAVVCLPAQTTGLVAGGAVPDGFSLWGRAGDFVGAEMAFTRVARETERSPREWVRREEAETLDAGASLRLRAARVAVYGGAGISRETVVSSFQFLHPEPSAKFGGVERRLAPYASGAATVQLWRKVHAFGRYTWRGNAAFAARQTVAAGLAITF